MYRKIFSHRDEKINKKNIIILAVLLVLIMVGGYFGLNKDVRISTIDKVKSYLSSLELRSDFGEEEFEEALIADLSSRIPSIIGNGEENGKLTEEALSIEKTKEVLGEETTAVPKLTLKEISEQVNKVSKKVALVSIQVQILTLKDISSQITKEEDLGEDTLEDISERMDQVSEQIESITLQLQQLSSI